MLLGAAPLPDAVVGLLPYFPHMLNNRPRQRPRPRVELQLRQARLIEGIDQLAVNVELQLGMGGVADADRLRAFIAGHTATTTPKTSSCNWAWAALPIRTGCAPS